MNRIRRVQIVWIILLTSVAAQGSPLQDRIDPILKKFGLGNSQASLKVVRLPEGEVLYERRSEELSQPASTVKLVTGQAAMKFLGPDYTYPTEFYSDGPMTKGAIRNLWIKGYGDPFFVTEELEKVVEEFREKGLSRIEGNVYVDDTWFDQDDLVTYISDRGGKTYKVLTGALSFNFNAVELIVRPASTLGQAGIVEMKHPTRYVSLRNRVVTKKVKWPVLSTSLDGGVVTTRGKIPPGVREVSIRQGIHEPAVFTGTLVVEGLQKTGVYFEGKVIRGIVPPMGTLLMRHESLPLKELIHGLGKFSNNFTAEQILKGLGAVLEGAPGNRSKGRESIQKYLISLGIIPETYYLENGSGLSKTTRLSASQIVQVLKDIYDSPWREDFISSLSVAGVDGTIESKFGGPLRGKIFAKTGSLRKVNALAGFIRDQGNDLAFAFLFNDFSVSSDRVDEAEERILREILRK